MIVFFKDKNADNQLQEFSERSKGRRKRNKVQADVKDLLVNADYLAWRLLEDGVLMGTSRWLNAVAFSSSLSEIRTNSKTFFYKQGNSSRKGQRIRLQPTSSIPERSL